MGHKWWLRGLLLHDTFYLLPLTSHGVPLNKWSVYGGIDFLFSCGAYLQMTCRDNKTKGKQTLTRPPTKLWPFHRHKLQNINTKKCLLIFLSSLLFFFFFFLFTIFWHVWPQWMLQKQTKCFVRKVLGGCLVYFTGQLPCIYILLWNT